MSKLPDFLIAHLGINGSDQTGSGATSPGAEWRDDEGDQQSRYRPRTYPYHRYLPYDVEDEAERQTHLDGIVRNLYIAIEARDFSPGALRWSRELRSWLALKFDPPRKTRAKLVRLYYELAMAPGLDPAVSERFASMFMTLTKYISKSPLFSCYSLVAFTTIENDCNYHLFVIQRMLRNLKAETLFTSGERFELGLEAALQRAQGLCTASRVRIRPYNNCEEEYAHLDKDVLICAILLQSRGTHGDV